MNFFGRLSNGWKIAKTSFQTINENRQLLLLPLVSGAALIVVLLTFFGGAFFLIGGDLDAIFSDETISNVLAYGLIFVYYLITYFIIVFFNAALIHCSIDIFNEKPTSLSAGIQYAMSKLPKIFAWAVVSATVGMVLQMIQSTGKIGEFIGSLLGGAWSIMTFFVVPIVIYEEKNVFDSVKESLNILKEKWGESLGGSFSFGIIQALGLFVGFCIGSLLVPINPVLGIGLGGAIVLLTITVTNAARTVFVAAVYNHVRERPTGSFDTDTLDGVFFNK